MVVCCGMYRDGMSYAGFISRFGGLGCQLSRSRGAGSLGYGMLFRLIILTCNGDCKRTLSFQALDSLLYRRD